VHDVEDALEDGYRHVDMTKIYGNGGAVGRGIAQDDVSREEIFLRTKVRRDRCLS